MFLLDVNVLLALAWPNHVHHAKAVEWFESNASAGWVTCPLTQCGFVRISSNPRFTPAAVRPVVACQLLDKLTAHPSHMFWPDDLTIHESIQALDVELLGHHQVTDAYLLAMTSAGGDTLVTFDQAIKSLAGQKYVGNVEILAS